MGKRGGSIGRFGWPALAVAALGPGVGLALAAGCRGGSAAEGERAAAARFVGNEACRECHPTEFEAHRASRHNETLRPATLSRLGELAPPLGKIPGTVFEIRRKGEELEFARADKAGEAERIEYAFGSGKTGMTYVAVHGSDTVFEMRMSCFPHQKDWYLTPGQEGAGDHDIGHAREGAIARKCFSCHTSSLEAGSVRPAGNQLGVGCESCHGPGSAHIAAAMTAGARDLRMEKIGTWGAERINRHCGRCHRTVDDIDLAGTEATMTQRFQPYGIMQSPCFKKSEDRLSCLTCHNPHTNASTSERHYEAACLRCHGGDSGAGARRLMRSKVCPVNAREKCIGCHMPQRKVFPSSKVPVTMADHLIWAYGRRK